MPQDDDALIGEITTALELDHQYLRSIEEWNDDLVAQIRRSGRAAGRCLGYLVRTFTSDPDWRKDRRRIVCIAVIASSEEDAKRIEARSRLLLEEFHNSFGF